ncbi:chemotaxis protein CheA, partial [Rhizobium ruizarguesonis]
LTVKPVEEARADATSNDELPMVPVPFDLSILDETGATEEVSASDARAEETAAAVAAAETASNVTQMVAARVEKKESAAAAAAARFCVVSDRCVEG